MTTPYAFYKGDMLSNLVQMVADARKRGTVLEAQDGGVVFCAAGDSDPALLVRDYKRVMAGVLDPALPVGPTPTPALTPAEQVRWMRGRGVVVRLGREAAARQARAVRVNTGTLERFLAFIPPMERNETMWAEAVQSAQDNKSRTMREYGLACLAYAERWACLMQAGMTSGKPLADVVEYAAQAAVIDPMAVTDNGRVNANTLCRLWAHGEALRHWMKTVGFKPIPPFDHAAYLRERYVQVQRLLDAA